MARRKLQDRLIDRSKITEDIVLVNESNVDYVSTNGNVYCDYGNGNFLKKSCFINKHNGYVYVSIHGKNGKQLQRRVHKLVAEAFLKKENFGCNVVMHLDNDKTNNNVWNLKWGTVSENTQQAFDDGLEVNKKGFEDEQSMPIVVFTLDGKIKDVYGSVSIAAEAEGVTKTGILYQANHKVKNPLKMNRSKRYFRFLNEYVSEGFVL